MSTVTCHTEGCGNAEVPIEAELTYRDDNNVVRQITQVYCGVCGNPITDIRR
jgi:hypothetical protein